MSLRISATAAWASDILPGPCVGERQCILLEPGVTGEVRFVNKLFDLAA
jgi:hypothetical protein